VSGRLSPLARRPLLDGFVPPPAYRWVSPPPDLASSNKRPAAGRFSIDLDPTTGSQANVFSTADTQVSLALGRGAIPPRGGDTTVALLIAPLAPREDASLPPRMDIAGNVYRITATYQPSGAPVGQFRQSGQLVLAYPLPSGALAFRHSLVRSADGRSWTAVRSTDSIGQQLVQADVNQVGYFAAAQSTSGTPKPSSSLRNMIFTIFIWGGFAFFLVALLVGEVRRRSRRKPSGKRGPTRQSRRPPPKR
jgi:hypothetical protein